MHNHFVFITFILQAVKTTLTTASILDLPIEIFHNVIFRYLEHIDVYNLGRAGSKQLEEISTAYVELGKRSDSSLALLDSSLAVY